jgi:hypothetical protein
MKPATQIAHWPGNDVPVCEDHAKKIVGLGGFMGFAVSLTPCEETVCTNCENEAKKK